MTLGADSCEESQAVRLMVDFFHICLFEGAWASSSGNVVPLRDQHFVGCDTRVLVAMVCCLTTSSCLPSAPRLPAADANLVQCRWRRCYFTLSVSAHFHFSFGRPAIRVVDEGGAVAEETPGATGVPQSVARDSGMLGQTRVLALSASTTTTTSSRGLEL